MKIVKDIFYKPENKSLESDSKRIDYLYIFYLLCIAIISIATLYSLLIRKYSKNIGEFGDSFGGLSSVFSGLAFAGVIITIIMQMKELQLTREEMILARRELSRAAKAQEDSQLALSQQLESMKSSSNIDALIYYLDKELQTHDEDVYVAKQIIKKETEKLFNKKEYADYLQPNFLLLSEHFPQSGEYYKYLIRCIGLDVEDVEINAHSKEYDVEVELDKDDFTYGEEFYLHSNIRLRNIHVYFYMSDKRNWDYWEMSLFIPDSEPMNGKFVGIKKQE